MFQMLNMKDQLKVFWLKDLSFSIVREKFLSRKDSVGELCLPHTKFEEDYRPLLDES